MSDTNHTKPTYEELQQRLAETEEIIRVLRSGEIDAIISERDIALVRLRATEEALQQLNKTLLGRTAQLEAANKELEAFSYSVSHDLRNPLRAVDGFARILFDNYQDKLDDEGKRLLKVVRDNAARMGQMISDMLAFSRAGRTEVRQTEIDMEALIHMVVADLQPAMDGRDVRVEIQALPRAWGDPAMIRQVLENLIDNALKFTQPKKSAVVKIGAQPGERETVYFVKDNGVGFNMEYAGRLFGVFQRLHSVGEFEGTGIGLAIVKRIVERHGGRVWADGKVNEGATFYFTLPLKDRLHG